MKNPSEKSYGLWLKKKRLKIRRALGDQPDDTHDVKEKEEKRRKKMKEEERRWKKKKERRGKTG